MSYPGSCMTRIPRALYIITISRQDARLRYRLWTHATHLKRERKRHARLTNTYHAWRRRHEELALAALEDDVIRRARPSQFGRRHGFSGRNLKDDTGFPVAVLLRYTWHGGECWECTKSCSSWLAG